MRQYRRIKQQHGDAILFFRLGDFYEMFESDAKEVSSLLNITLTSRHNIPMCGLPYHAAGGYISRLLKAGKKIAICEQISLPQDGKGIAEREVVEIVTPGTVVDEEYLDESANNFLVAIGKHREYISLSYLDLSTGFFGSGGAEQQNRVEFLKRELARLNPRELLIQESLLEDDQEISRLLGGRSNIIVNRLPDWSFDMDTSRELLKRQFGVASLKGFGIAESDRSILSAGPLLEYVSDTSKSLLQHILDIQITREQEYMGLDESTIRNLELMRNIQDGDKRYSLLEVLDHTKSSMGARLLKRWLLNPLTDKMAIEKRQEDVATLYKDQLLLSSLREQLSGVLDLERLSAKISMDKAHAKDLLAVKNTLHSAAEIHAISSQALAAYQDTTVDLEKTKKIENLLEDAVHEDPSILLTEGRLIRKGYHEEIDTLRSLRDNSRGVLEAYLQSEREKSGIQNLRVRYNKIIGYFLEVTKGNLNHVPDHFIRRQSLVGSERFTTDRLIQLETDLNSADGRIVELEREVFLTLRDTVKSEVKTLVHLAQLLSRIDSLCSFAYAATLRGYTRPKIETGTGIQIRDGRHPVVEAHLPAGSFVPNDVDIDAEHVSFALITGPNMAGKSTFLRQVALICLMAQAGAFVPARDATIGIVDRIFCRVGASDNLSRGESTFLVEMNETAHILRSATKQSLVIMDEVGRGPDTNDGVSIARAVSEYLLKQSPKTLFATHFHELTLVEHAKKRNLALEVLEKKGEVVFLKKVREGVADHSYGIHVAQLAGLPREVILRASELLNKLLAQNGKLAEKPEEYVARSFQTSLFTKEEMLLQEIRSANLEEMTPLEALNLLARWQQEFAELENL